jgi:hypothetical protein
MMASSPLDTLLADLELAAPPVARLRLHLQLELRPGLDASVSGLVEVADLSDGKVSS